MHYVGDFVVSPDRSAPVTVRSTPCRIEIEYRLPDAPRIRSLYFPCALNQFQAPSCAGSFSSQVDRRGLTVMPRLMHLQKR